MEFDLDSATNILSRTPVVLRALLQGLPAEWTNATEGSESWSAYTILGHLIHGENDDWIPRVRTILRGDGERKFAPFDRFAQFEESRGKSLAQLLDEFESRRRASLDELRAMQLSANDLDKTGTHPAFGAVTLRQLLSTWVVHDLAHLGQIARVLAKQYKHEVGPWSAYLSVLNDR